jgi:hypothetical protein
MLGDTTIVCTHVPDPQHSALRARYLHDLSAWGRSFRQPALSVGPTLVPHASFHANCICARAITSVCLPLILDAWHRMLSWTTLLGGLMGLNRLSGLGGSHVALPSGPHGDVGLNRFTMCPTYKLRTEVFLDNIGWLKVNLYLFRLKQEMLILYSKPDKDPRPILEKLYPAQIEDLFLWAGYIISSIRPNSGSSRDDSISFDLVSQ